MAETYDLVIIGAGTAAMTAAMRVRGAGWRVAVIDFRPYGGTCALRGCDPKKMLVGGAAALDYARRMHGKGLAGAVSIDWKELMAFKRGFTGSVPEKHEQRYREKGIDTYHGRARFMGRNSLDVEGRRLDAHHVLLAAGAEPVRLGIPGEEYVSTSDDFLSLEQLPRRIALIGGGYVAAELSHLAVRAGARVTILQRRKRLLKHFDPDLVDWITEKSREIGVDVRLGTTVDAVERADGGLIVRTTSAGGDADLEVDLVVHAAGRAPALETLDLEAGNVAMEAGRLVLNDYLQSVTNPAVYAAGDAAQKGPPLTPVSSHDAKTVAANLLEGNRHRPDYRGIPSVAFTLPPIAAVGLSEKQAREQGLKFRVSSRRASDWFTARQAAEKTYGYKVIVEEGSGRVLSAHLVGPHADEVINLFSLAIRHDLNAGQLKSTMFAYPTGASDIGYML